MQATNSADRARPDATADLNDALGHLARVMRLFATADPDVISSMQMVALGTLLQRGGARLTELADGLGCDLSVASRQMNVLVERGYASRTRDPDDGRAWQFWLTDDGSRALEGIRAKRVAWLRDTLASFDDAQRRTATDVVTTLAGALAATRGKPRLSITPPAPTEDH